MRVGATVGWCGRCRSARDRLEARLCEALVGFFSAGRHDVEGWRSPVGWLKANGALTDRDARRLAVRADRLRRWPVLARSWFDGEISGAQVEVVVALVPGPLVDLYADHDAEVSPCLVGLESGRHPGGGARVGAARRGGDVPGPAEVAAAVEVDARVRLSRTLGGRGVLDADLDPLTAELVETALRVVERPDTPGSSAPPPNGAARTCAGWPASSSITSPRTATAPGAGTPTCSR